MIMDSVDKRIADLEREKGELLRQLEHLQTGHHEKCARPKCPYRLIIPMQGESAVEYLARLAQEAESEEEN